MNAPPDWTASRRRQAGPLMLVAVMCVAAATWIWPQPALIWQLAFLAAGVLTIGMPHGAMDHRVAEAWLRPRLGRRWGAAFAGLYLGLAAIMLIGWALMPLVAIVAFLSYSALHFGLGDCPRRPWVAALAHGALPILLPLALHPAEAGQLLSWVAGRTVDLTPHLVWLRALVTVATTAALLDAALVRDPLRLSEVVAVVCVNFAAPPLIAFAAYFVFVHSVRHMIELAAWLEPQNPPAGLRRIARECLPLTALTLVAIGVAAWWLGRAGNAGPPAAGLIRMLFVTLSCLTVPHMLVTAGGEAALSPRRLSSES